MGAWLGSEPEIKKDHIQWAFSVEDEGISRNARLVLLVLAFRADQDGIVEKVPPADLLSLAKLDVSVVCVSVILRELVSSGYIMDEGTHYMVTLKNFRK